MEERKVVGVFVGGPTRGGVLLKDIGESSSGFVYAVSRTGVTGARQQMPEDAPQLVGRLRRYTDLPVAVGFGISTSAQFMAVAEFAHAAVAGAAIVKTIVRTPGE